MGYEILKETLVAQSLRMGLFNAQTLSYKKILSEKWRDRSLPIGEDTEVCDIGNDYFESLKEQFDEWDAKSVSECLSLSDDVLARAVNSVIKVRGKRTIRKSKKQSTRVFKEVKKMWKNGDYNSHDPDLYKALELIHKAFRESFVKIRVQLRRELYECIPQDLEIILQNGDKYTVTSLYAYEEEEKYRICNNIQISYIDLRNMQLLIAPYIFKKLIINEGKGWGKSELKNR